MPSPSTERLSAPRIPDEASAGVTSPHHISMTESQGRALMQAHLQKFRRRLAAALDTYWLQLTVGQTSYPGLKPDATARPVRTAEAAAASAQAGAESLMTPAAKPERPCS